MLMFYIDLFGHTLFEGLIIANNKALTEFCHNKLQIFLFINSKVVKFRY